MQPFLPEPHADLDSEIDGDADEQHGERDRHQVESSHRQRREPGGQQQAQHQRQ